MSAARTIWVAEIKEAGSWYTLWTTCRLYKHEAKEALEEHPGYQRATEARIIKFERGTH